MLQNFNLHRNLLFISIYFLSNFIIKAQDIWQDVSESSIVASNERYIIPANYKTYALDLRL